MQMVKFSNGLPLDIDRYFDLDPFNGQTLSKFKKTIPAVNIKESFDAFKLQLAVPGLDKKDIKISFHENKLSISYEHTEEHQDNQETQNEKFLRKEFSSESFSRTFTLPDVVDSEKIEAQYNDGVLNINLPKKEEAKPKPPRKIELQ